MADYTYRKVERTRHEWRVPGAQHGGWGAPVAELHKALNAAERLYKELTGKEPTYDDWLRIWAGDEDIILWFEVEVSGRG